MKPRTLRLWMWAGTLLVLLAVFSLYTQPAFLVMLVNQLWACF